MISYSLQNNSKGQQKTSQIGQLLAKLLTLYFFFAKEEFVNEVYYRFIKTHLVNCDNEEKLGMI